jgi:glycolate oxidase FAD binding subunit
VGLTAAPPASAFAIDELTPARHVPATSETDVVEAIRAANEERGSIVLWGGGTRIGIGDAPARYDVALDLRGLRGIVQHEPADLTVTVRAGTTVAELQAALAPHGQWWPVEVAHPDRATVGGTIASAADGPARFRYFHPRDWTIGVRAVLGDGTLTKAGGRVVKNVTGYDLTRLYSGSFGTLCAIVETSLKLAPLPRRSVTVRVDMPDLRHGYLRTRDLLRDRPPLDAIALVTGPLAETVGGPTWAALFIRIAGTPAAVDRVRDAVARRVGAVEAAADVWQRIADAPADAPTSVRGTWPAGQPLELYATSSVWYPGVEILHLLDEHDADELRDLRSAAEASAGALVIERAPTALRRAVGTWGTPRIPPVIAERLRALFDPRSVLAPGRMP